MRFKIYLAVTVAICMIVISLLNAATERESKSLKAARISTGDVLSVKGGTTVDVPIVLTTTNPLAGIQISLDYDRDIMTPGEPITTERSSGMSVAHTIDSGTVLILLYDVAGKTISPGSGPVLTIPFTVSQNAEGLSEIVFREVILADEQAKAVPTEVKSAPITIEKALPTEYALVQNSPNPFNPETVIEYQLPEDAYVTITIYNVLGQEIRRLVDGRMPGGFYSVVWDGANGLGQYVASGIYFFRMQAGDFTSVRKMMMLK
jgi:hypothetical protein